MTGLWITSFSGLFQIKDFSQKYIYKITSNFSARRPSVPPDLNLICMSSLIADWSPEEERERLSGKPKGLVSSPENQAPFSESSQSSWGAQKGEDRNGSKGINCFLWLWAGLTLTVVLFPPAKTHAMDGCKGKGRKPNTFPRPPKMSYHQATGQYSTQSLLTNVIGTVANVGRDLFHALVVQHSLLLGESAG